MSSDLDDSGNWSHVNFSMTRVNKVALHFALIPVTQYCHSCVDFLYFVLFDQFYLHAYVNTRET